MAKRVERVFVLTMVVLFFVTSFGFSFFAIWESHQGSSNSTNNTNTTVNTTTPTTKLAGTKLQGFTPISNVSTLQTKDLSLGTGPAVKPSDTVTVSYTGAVAATGLIFQSTYDSGQTATFSLSQVIKGWEIGMPGMKAGGTRQLLIPASLAYGANPRSGSGIPPNAALVFNVYLVKID